MPLVSPAAAIACGFLAFIRPPKKAFQRFIKRVWRQLPDKLADKTADRVADIIWFVVALGLWHEMTRLGVTWPRLK